MNILKKNIKLRLFSSVRSTPKVKCVNDDWFFSFCFFPSNYGPALKFPFGEDEDQFGSIFFFVQTCHSISNKSSQPYLIENILIECHMTTKLNVSTADYIKFMAEKLSECTTMRLECKWYWWKQKKNITNFDNVFAQTFIVIVIIY